MFQWSGECVIVHYPCIQVVSNTLPCFFSLIYYCGGVSFLFNDIFYLLVCLRRGKVSGSTCHVESVTGSIWGSRERALIQDWFHLAWWIVSAHPGFVFVQRIKPGRSCFGFTELSSVTYPGCLNPTFVQRAPGVSEANWYVYLSFSCDWLRKTKTLNKDTCVL